MKVTNLGIRGKFLAILLPCAMFLQVGVAVMAIKFSTDAQQQQAQVFTEQLRREQAAEETLLKQNLMDKARSTASLLSNTGAALIVGYDFTALQELADHARQDREIDYVVFYGKEGNTLTTAPENEAPEVVKQDILFEDEKIGSLDLGLNYRSINETMAGITERIAQLTDANKQAQAQAKASISLKFGVLTLVGVLVLSAVVVVSLTRYLSRPLHGIITSLTEGSDHVASASGQVSSASQSLAEGATEQAAGLEETSSSLEEMSSMTRQNADNAQQANALASEARQTADGGTEAMQRMTAAITDIQASSDDTAKIIKVIDDIAFQTNLLALNAAVEAARAGEAGKGFAVVAEEVRNLAMRSAEAAKNTSNMIEESVKNAKNGVDIAAEVGTVLEQIVQSVTKTTDLVGEIAAASQEQARGIDQVNTAVTQMDKVTQQNAANAEESASASEELSAEAKSMEDIVGQLVALVNGSSRRGSKAVGAAPRSGFGRRLAASSGRFGKSDETLHQIADPAGPKGPLKSTAVSAAEHEFPLGDGGDSFDQFNA